MVIIISFLLSILPVFIINPTDKPRVVPNALAAPEDGFAEKDLSLQITAVKSQLKAPYKSLRFIVNSVHFL